MPKVLTEGQVEQYQRDGCLSPVRAMSAEFPAHMGYKPAQDTPILVEAEA